MRYLLFLLMTGIALQAKAIDIAEKPVAELLDMSEHVIVAKVIKVDALDAFGNSSNNPDISTGPGTSHSIRLHIKPIDILKTNSKSTPETIIITLWRLWKYRLGDIREGSEGHVYVFLLKGKDYIPVYPRYFIRNVLETGHIKQHLKQHNK